MRSHLKLDRVQQGPGQYEPFERLLSKGVERFLRHHPIAHDCVADTEAQLHRGLRVAIELSAAEQPEKRPRPLEPETAGGPARMHYGQLAAWTFRQRIGPDQAYALARTVAVRDQLTVKGQDTAAFIATQAQGLQTELHAESSPIIEEGLAYAFGGTQLIQHIGTHQISTGAGVFQRIEVFADEQVQVPILKLLQATVGPEEGFEIFQRGVTAGGREGVLLKGDDAWLVE
jgi:hypothetical protein